MKSGRAYAFTDRALRYEALAGCPCFPNWTTFRTEFVKEFLPKNEAQRAITCLETTAYYQGKHSVDEYIDKFKDLIDSSGYSDGLAIVIKFRRGLDPEIQNYVAQMVEGRPKDDDIEGWYLASSRCDENRTANAAFRSQSRPVPYVRPLLTQTRFSTPSTRPTSAPHAPLLMPVSNVPAPMDVDAARRSGPRTMVCYRCGKAGHLRKDCPRGFDVRFMTEDERADWIQQLLASADVRDAEECEEEAEEKVETGEGFVPSDK